MEWQNSEFKTCMINTQRAMMEKVDKLIVVSAEALTEILRMSYMMAFNTTTLEMKNVFGGQ